MRRASGGHCKRTKLFHIEYKYTFSIKKTFGRQLNSRYKHDLRN